MQVLVIRQVAELNIFLKKKCIVSIVLLSKINVLALYSFASRACTSTCLYMLKYCKLPVCVTKKLKTWFYTFCAAQFALNQNQLWHVHTHFPVLHLSYMYLLPNFIGSIYTRCLFWLAWEITVTLVLTLRHSIEKHTLYWWDNL